MNPSVTGDKDVDVIERTKKRFSITEVVRGQAVELRSTVGEIPQNIEKLGSERCTKIPENAKKNEGDKLFAERQRLDFEEA